MRALLTYLPKFLTRGALLSLATLATAAAMAQTVTTSTNFPVGLGISDGSAVGIASFKSVTTPVRFITGLQVGVKISGTFNGDLYCYLVHNSGFSVLLNRPGRRVGSTFGYFDPGMDITFDDAAANGDVHNYRLALNGSQSVALSAPLSGVWRPDGRTNSPLTVLDSDISRAGLSSFQGLDPNGDWLLFVADLATGDLHLLDNWSLTITGYLAPTIGTQPADQLVQCSSGIANFNVSATGSGTLSYQWRLAGVNLSGATNASLSITNPASAAAGAYDVVVTGSSGSVTSSVATLTIVDMTAPVVTLSGSPTVIVECHGSFTDPGASALDACAGPLPVAISGAVNANVPGVYTLTYSATDPNGNVGTATRTVTVADTIAPVVTLVGSSAITVECHGTFVDPGATAMDTCAGAVSVAISGAVDANVPGLYTLTYSATDPSGKTGTATRTVTVSDTTPPIVSLIGNAAVTVECHGAFTDPGATATDACAGALTPTRTGSLDLNTPGVYTLTYSATDPSGKTGTATRTVTVSDTTPPIVTLVGNSAMTVECHDAFTDPGATALDTCAGAVSVTVGGTVNANVPGVYTLTYSATDPSGKTGTATRTVTVSDTTPPMVTLIGSAAMTVECHGSFTDPGATATDVCAGALTATRTGTFDANTPGVYTLTYSATDPSGKTGTATRTVTVSDTIAPVVTLVGSATMTVECHGTFTDPGATAVDACAGTLPIATNGSVTANIPGVYTLTYSATDPSGKTGTATRTVTVSDTTAPVVTLVGSANMTVECHGTFTDPGATAADACAGALTPSVSGSVSVNTPGVYTLTYSATDPSGKTGTATRTVTVSDTVPPVVTLVGNASITVECHGSFVDPGATALDACAGSLSVATSGSVNANVTGVYTLIYSATDPSGKTGTATRTVTVSDTTPPVVTLAGSSSITVECHGSFVDPGATALDTCAGTLAVATSGSVNANVPGVYTLTYSATDPSGKTGTTTRTVTVSDTTPPVVTLIGNAAVTVECHGSFTDPGATATDVCAGVLTPTQTGSLDLNTPGVYTLTYSATDPSGKTGTITRTVTVSDTTAPVVALVGNTSITVECHGSFVDPGATAVDACAGALPVATNGSVNANIPGVYMLTYSATDPSGKTGTATRTVTVSDTTPPVVTLVGSASMTVECHGSFVDPGATALDACAGTLTVGVSGTVNANVPGVYTLTYSATDPAGKTGSATRTATVSDTTPPVVTLLGSASVTIECHGSFNDPGATAVDLCAGSLTPVVSGTVDLNTPGAYTRTFTATDSSGNSALATRTIIVADTTLPTISCPANISSFTTNPTGMSVTFTVTSQDTCSGALTPNCIPPSGFVFPIGTTTVNCAATDASQNSTSCSFTVTLLRNHAPAAGDILMGTLANHPKQILLGKMLVNDTDADGDIINVTAVSALSTNGGSVTLASTGVVYTPKPNYLGLDLFTYTISDGRGGIATGNVVVKVSSESEAPNRIGPIQLVPGGVKFTFAGIPGFTYAVQRSTDLINWAGVGSITVPLSGTTTFEDLNPVAGSAFYRTRTED